MEKYRRVETPKTESKINENEIRITAQGRARSYISYATNLLQTKGATEIVLKAMGYAINKTITVAEIIKRRVPDLHQNTQLDSTDIKEIWEPIEEGLDNVETVRHVSSIQITLSKQPLDTNAPGYQPPLPADQVGLPESKTFRRPRRGGRPYGGGGRGRGGAGPNGPGGAPGVGEPTAPIPQEHEAPHRGGFRGRGGRGRGGRGGYRGGRGRGGYFPPGDAHQHQQQFGGSVGVPMGSQAGNAGGAGLVGAAPGGRGRGRGGRGRGRGGRGRGRGAHQTSMAPMTQGHPESVPPQNP